MPHGHGHVGHGHVGHVGHVGHIGRGPVVVVGRPRPMAPVGAAMVGK
jgi:hypothetical protein